MKLMTPVEIEKDFPHISHKDKVLVLGSCFSDNIGEKLHTSGFQVDINPFGTLYNPVSIARATQEIRDGKTYMENDLFNYQGLWQSDMHHGSFSGPDKKTVLDHINDRISKAHNTWRNTNLVLLTFGSAFVYYNKTGEIVSNCHKRPESEFNRQRLSIEDIISLYEPLFHSLFEQNKELNIIMTVSPIRHLRDGLHQNQLSKSTLLLAIDKLKSLFPHNIYYFPAYEIMMDELRDYRFYTDDLMHPSTMAIEYLWEKFITCSFDNETQQLAEECQKIYKAINHRPLHADEKTHKEFLKQIVLKINRLKEKYPYLEFKTE
ncbi:MAG: GSCFA domain-containing protein [Bacteroidales bacterium]|nr:GSCFA domain-containing protein [Bacteroidales bacterium]